MQQNIESSHLRTPKTSKRTIIVGIVLLANILLLLNIFLRQFPQYPTGWDAPYYITYTKSFEQFGETSSRAGMITIVAALHSVTNISYINAYRMLTVVFMVLLALGTALLSTTVSRKRVTTFLITFFFALWYQYYFMLSLSTFDNALGVILVVFSCYFLAEKTKKKENAIAFSSLSILLAITHLESFAFLMLILGLFIVFRIVARRSMVQAVRENAWFCIAGIATSAVALLQWSTLIRSIVQTYAKTADVGGNASIPYAADRSFREFLHYAGTGVVDHATLVLFLIGLTFLVFLVKQRSSVRDRTAVIAYFLAAYGILLFSVLRASIPINRSILLLPVPLGIGMGLSWYVVLLQRKRKFGIAGVSIVLLFFALLPISKYVEYVKRVPPSISQTVYAGIADLNQYQQAQIDGSYVVLSNTQNEVKAASAYYLLWYHWLTALLPLPDTTKGYCAYFGLLENFPDLRPTVRPANQEYNDTNVESLSCIRSLPKSSPRLFVVRGLYPGQFPPQRDTFTVRQITENLVELVFTTK
ncbi:MAG: hypothetical protein V1778_00580 [bacterium]